MLLSTMELKAYCHSCEIFYEISCDFFVITFSESFHTKFRYDFYMKYHLTMNF